MAPGSNSWAVAGEHTASGAALLANDMHLPLTVPNVWYRASLVWPAEGEAGKHEVTGVTLPGLPMMVTGSNGHLAWGFSNAFADTSDLVVLEPDPKDSNRYQTPDGSEPFELHEESIRVRGGADEILEVRRTRWGPVVGADHQGRPWAYRWTALDSAAVNFRFLEMETASSLEEALEIAQLSGLPPQNLIVADEEGRIAWSIAGRIPRRYGAAGLTPTSWSEGSNGWSGYLGVDEIPQLFSPPDGRLWTANNRVIGGEGAELLGDGGWVPGARAQQIRDALFAMENPDEGDMLALQRDDRSLFLDRWRQVFLTVLTDQAVTESALRGAARAILEKPTTHASVDSVGYRLLRNARHFLSEKIFEALTAPCREADPIFNYTDVFTRHEAPLWALVTERPEHLLGPDYESWEAQILAALDKALDYLTAGGGALEAQTWGRRNTVRARHPLSLALPVLGRWLDMPARELPGDSYMPRVQHPSFGASQRMVVSPGREEEGIFHMPAGQSGHPLSPHYGDGQAAWAEASATPFLPGETVHSLILRPATETLNEGGES